LLGHFHKSRSLTRKPINVPKMSGNSNTNAQNPPQKDISQMTQAEYYATYDGGCSDCRLKKNICVLKESNTGVRICSWKWNSTALGAIGRQNLGRRRGVLAQDLLAANLGKFVTEGQDGFLRVLYGPLAQHLSAEDASLAAEIRSIRNIPAGKEYPAF
jgi:hypothetical protein